MYWIEQFHICPSSSNVPEGLKDFMHCSCGLLRCQIQRRFTAWNNTETHLLCKVKYLFWYLVLVNIKYQISCFGKIYEEGEAEQGESSLMTLDRNSQLMDSWGLPHSPDSDMGAQKWLLPHVKWLDSIMNISIIQKLELMNLDRNMVIDMMMGIKKQTGNIPFSTISTSKIKRNKV